MKNNFSPPEKVQSARLLLRKPEVEDAEPLFRSYTSDPAVTKFVVWQAHRDSGETRRFLSHCLEQWDKGNDYAYVIARREEAEAGNAPIGMISLRPKNHRVDFGYVLAHTQWGKGYMSEALACLTEWSLAQPEIWRAQAFCDAENTASARVMEKAGMTFEGVLRRYFVHPNVSPEPRDCRLYAKVRG